MATRLAQAGIITCIMQYTLYPAASSPDMAAQVDIALSTVLDGIGMWGGSGGNVTLVGHSAGSQLCAMALLHRSIRAESTAPPAEGSQPVSLSDGGSSAGARGAGERETYSDGRMPRRFVSMAGVFDIAKHYEYEQGRGVHELSTMARAVGGPDAFAAQSPTVILRSACGAPTRVDATDQRQPFYSSFPLKGEAIAHRIGLSRTAGSMLSSPSSPAAAPAVDVMSLTAVDAAKLPPTVLQSSTADTVVPWLESGEFHWALHDCGVRVKSLVYAEPGHGDFVTAWRPLPTLTPSHDAKDLPGFASDLIRIVKKDL
jgi:prenylcysteine alpha-carboxyl methylesterase